MTSKVRFPERRPDGSFTVHARFATSDAAVISRIEPFVSAWIRDHDPWPTEASLEGDQLLYSQAYDGPPRVEVEEAGRHFTLIFEGRALSVRWKDWLVYMTHDLRNAFPEVHFEAFSSQTSATE